MSEELNLAIIKRTQDTLGKYVKKPSLTEKLLKKPPFRFLHDVFSVIIRDTGCFVGLYTPEELTYENIKDREDKMIFLQKMIDVVNITTDSSLAIRTSKIVAGHEPEKTNELLQLMGTIIEKKLNWQTAVEQVRSGKTLRKQSPRKPKDATNKIAKNIKSQDKNKEKSKETEARLRDSKVIKAASSKAATTVNKDVKNKVNKTKDKTTVKTVVKERSSRGSKEPDKNVKKTEKETSRTKSKLTKTESQSSNKSSPSSNIQEFKKESLQSAQNEADCKHEEMSHVENSKIVTPPRKLSNNTTNNEMFNNDEVSIENPQVLSHSSHLEAESLSVKNSEKSSAKSRKSGHRKDTEELEEKNNNLETAKAFSPPSAEKFIISEAAEMSSLKQQSFSSPTNQNQQQIGKPIKSDTSQNIQKESSALQQQLIDQKPSEQQLSPPISFTNEMKRESTFTRENSKDSNQSSLANRPRTSLRPPSARPPSARPGAPRRRDKNVEIILQPNDQIKMSGIQVKLETFGDLDDDGENLVIIENPNANDAAVDQQSNLTESERMMQDETLGQGHLVQQILETQKELVQQHNNGTNQQKSDKDSTNGSVMRQTSARHMNNLRDVIQNLTKSVNPLGKLMDFIPEDMDAMQLEFTMWRDAYTQAANELKREKSLTESATEPLKNQLVQIEANIVEYLEMINVSRVKILQNSEKILKMLTSS